MVFSHRHSRAGVWTAGRSGRLVTALLAVFLAACCMRSGCGLLADAAYDTRSIREIEEEQNELRAKRDECRARRDALYERLRGISAMNADGTVNHEQDVIYFQLDACQDNIDWYSDQIRENQRTLRMWQGHDPTAHAVNSATNVTPRSPHH